MAALYPVQTFDARGGSHGISASAAQHIAWRGTGVILTYHHHPDAAAEAVGRIERAGGQTVALRLDVADVGSFGAFREAVSVVLQATWTSMVKTGRPATRLHYAPNY
jgi:NAD(P)-dependent dehydrogenase (short-subunit alcohol dehydrogenase family)